MGIREQVKQGKLPAAEAQNRVSPESKTYRWLERRIKRAQAANQTKGESK